MPTLLGAKREPSAPTSIPVSGEDHKPQRAIVRRGARWLADALAVRDTSQPRAVRRWLTISLCAGLFLIAVGVRVLYWQDDYAELTRGEPWMTDLARQYKSDAQRMREGGGVLFPRPPVDPSDARGLLHPPGYSMLMAAVFSLYGESSSAIRWVQIIGDGLAVALLFLIASELLNSAIAMIAGLIAALSPHLAFYSLWLSPDSLAVLPILLAVYLIIKAVQRPRLITIIAAGAMIGVSCWLRANALLLAPVLALVLAALVERGERLRYGLALVCATIIVIAPITIRNAIVYHRFIPLSIAGGENLVVGIGDFDKQGRFRMPVSDQDAARKDAEWHNRPDYAQNPWTPDGIERDQYRYARGLSVIRAHPFWFAGAMLRRAAFMLSYNDSRRADWPFNTSRVPIISAEPAVAHAPARADDVPPVWSSTVSGWLADDAIISKEAEVTLADDGRTLRVAGDGSEFGDQFASAIINVKAKTDYLLTLRIKAEQGAVAAKVTGADRRITLAVASVDAEATENGLSRKPKRERPGQPSDGLVIQEEMRLLQIAFASGDRNAVRLVISNNGPAAALHAARIGQAELFELGATPHWWTRLPRAVAHGLQKNLFKTTVMLPLVIAGIILVSLAGRARMLMVLLAVPAYYLCVQSALSTEYRYILAMHYFLFVFAGVALYCAGLAARQATLRLNASSKRRQDEAAGEEAVVSTRSS
ncbi:MAG TPA: glycosyltransferase family 39 protein [Blastocatellia bacterium]|nr:glycosyltransferase family 39 protein [Blastocatellia bacterium]